MDTTHHYLNKVIVTLFIVIVFNIPTHAIANLVENGNFSNGDTNWTTLILGTADSTFHFPKSDDKDGKVFVDVIDGGSKSYHVQLLQSGIELHEGFEYHIVFTAWSNEPGTEIEAQVIQDSSPYTNYGQDTFVLNDEPTKYMLRFQMTTSENNARFRFRLGGSRKSVYIDDVLFLEPEVVLLKLDDLRDLPDSLAGFEQAVSTINATGVSAGLGILGSSFIDNGTTEKILFYDYLISLDAQDNIEIWHHGWDHGRYDGGHYEFKGPSVEHQYLHLIDTIDLVFQKTNIYLRSFGASYNQTDNATLDALEMMPELEVWMLPRTEETGSKTVIKNRVNMEPSTGQLDLEHFLSNYNDPNKRRTEHMILQGHPGFWSEDDQIEFKDIIEYLIARGHTFVTPYEYHQINQGN